MAVFAKLPPDTSKMTEQQSIKALNGYLYYMQEALEYAVSSRWGNSTEGIASQLSAVQSIVAGIASAVAELQALALIHTTDIDQNKSDITDINTTITEIQASIVAIQEDITQIQSDITSLDSRVTALENP